jgi:hypothetical protein
MVTILSRSKIKKKCTDNTWLSYRKLLFVILVSYCIRKDPMLTKDCNCDLLILDKILLLIP